MPDKSVIKDTAEVIKGIVDAVPVYQDVVQPTAKEVGKALQTVTKTIHVALAPISGLVWGYEKIASYLDSALSEKLKNIQKKKIITPSPHVAVPAIEALRYTGEESLLREMYTNLLASSMVMDTSKFVHPAYVDIIKQMTPDEAKMMKYIATTEYTHPLVNINIVIDRKSTLALRKFCNNIVEFSGCERKELSENYIENLCRLKLIDIYKDVKLADNEMYIELEERLKLDKNIMQIQYNGKKVEFSRSCLEVTSFGKNFCKVCIS